MSQGNSDLPWELEEGLKLRFCDLSVPEAAQVPLINLVENPRTGTVRGRQPFGPNSVLRFIASEWFFKVPEVRADVVSVLYSTATSDFENLALTVRALQDRGVSCVIIAFTRQVKQWLRQTSLPWIDGKRLWVGDLVASRRYLDLATQWDFALDGEGRDEAEGAHRWPFLLYHVVSCLGMERFLREVFIRAGAKVLLTGTDVQPETKLAVAVARVLGIPSVTIQHGILPQHPGDLPYLPAWSDHIAVWGPGPRNWFIEAGIHPDRLTATGCPRFDSYVHMRAENEALEDTDGGVVTLLLNPNPLSIRETELKEYVEAFRETSWRPVLRLHPAESREQLEELWRTIAPESLRDLTVISQKESLGEILQGSNVAITYDSTAGLEAMLLGIPVVVYGSHFHPTASPYPVWDELRPLNDPETLREALRHIQGDPSLHSRIIAFQDRYAETVNGRLDGRATKRLTELVLRVASTRGIAATHRPDALSRPEAGARDLSPR